ncbi:MAG TPA: response regulator [Nitrospirae bacterium]|nr:response regulator [Nitrospirota bacterium]
MVYPANGKPSVILLVEDNPADLEIMKMAFNDDDEFSAKVLAITIENGIEAMEYLNRKGEYSDSGSSPRPDLILLDINIPLMDGKAVLKEIKSTSELKNIPVVMFTSSENEKDIAESYALGANAYLTKPDEIDDFTWMIQSTGFYWLFMAKLPSNREFG